MIKGYLYLILIAEDEKSRPFYEQYGFEAANGAALMQIRAI